MKEYSLEVENGIEYVVINISEDEANINHYWKNVVKENYEILNNPNFKLIIPYFQGKDTIIIYTEKDKFHNLFGPAFCTIDHYSGSKNGTFWINGNSYSEEAFINETRRIKLNSILNETNN